MRGTVVQEAIQLCLMFEDGRTGCLGRVLTHACGEGRVARQVSGQETGEGQGVSAPAGELAG